MMKKMITVLILSLFITTGAYATSYQYSPGTSSGGFVGPGGMAKIVAAASIQDMRRNVYVALEGKLISRHREDYYVFADSSGEVIVEIEGSVFRGATVTPETKVRLTGEVSRSWNRTYVYIYHLEVVK